MRTLCFISILIANVKYGINSSPQSVSEPDITTFHAGAETHIYANETNAKGEKFIPYLVGLATVCNMHTKDEYLDYKSILKGHELLTEIFRAYNS